VTHDEILHQSTVSLPGFSADDINRTGNLSIIRVLHWAVIARTAAFHIPSKTGYTFLEYDRLTEGIYTFFASSKVTVSNELYSCYSLATPSTTCPQPLDIRLKLGYIGNSSLSTVATIIDRSTGAALAQNINHVALVSMQTRRPTPIPDWWKEKYSSAVTDSKPLVIPVMDVPTHLQMGMARYDMKVPWSEVDGYRHTSYLSYIRFCFDAATDATVKGCYTAFSGDFLNYRAKSIQALYKNECLANDMLTVVSWEAPDNPLKLNFSIQNVENSVVFQSSIEFYERST
jgi:acyl-CoA thioesterase FadM